jgi:Outer membrane protein beta-barrel domain
MKYFTSLLLCSFYTFTTSGQNHFIGVKGGYGWMNASMNLFTETKTQPGFAAGLTYEFQTKKKISLGAELLYERRGFINEILFSDIQGNLTGEKYPTHYRYDYFSLPLKVGYTIGNKFFGFGNIGVCPAILSQASWKLPTFHADMTQRGDTIIYFTEKPSKFNIAGLAEIGCGYKISNHFSIATSFRFQYSFSSLTNDNYFKNYYIRHRGMILSLAIKYNLSYKSQTTEEPIKE